MKEFNDKKFLKSNKSSNIDFDTDNIIIFHFKEMLNNYVPENNNFNINMRRNLLKDFNDLLKYFDANYVSRSNFGRNRRVKYPTIYFIDRLDRNQNNVVLLNYLFDCNKKNIHVVLKANRNKSKINDNINLIKELFKQENINYIQHDKEPFLESIILKTYSIENLDMTSILDDLKIFIDLFEKVNYICTDFPSSRVVNDFNQILDKYESEKEKPINASFFASKLQNLFTKDVSDLVKNIIINPKEKYAVKSSFGIGSWADKPIISIVNVNIFDSFQEGLHINYTFDTKKSKLYLSINPRSKNKRKYLILKDKLIEELGIILNSDNEFIVGNNDIDEYSVVLKEYDRSDINNYTLKNDLKYILPIYSKLCDAYTKNESSDENSDLNDVVFFEENTSKMNNLNNSNIENYDDINVIDVKSHSLDYFNALQYLNNINEFEILFNEDNIEKISEFDFKYEDYKDILDNILKSFNRSFNNILDENDLKNMFNSLSSRDKMLLFAKSFANFEYKSVGKPLGYLSFNTIYVDDRLPVPLIITTIIHELAHYLLTEILEQIMMKILNTNKTPLIESFVCLLLQEDLWFLLDEFCAHTVEGRFAPYNYQDYGSYEYKKDEVSRSISKQDIEYSLVIANTFAQDIKSIFESFISEKLRDQIKIEFYNSNIKPNDVGINHEIEATLNHDGLMLAIRQILFNGAEVCKNKKEELEHCVCEFEKYYLVS